MKTLHIITRLIVGGAQENTLHTCEDQVDRHGDEVTLVIGPDAGPEGSLIERAERGPAELVVLDSLRRSIAPRSDVRAYREIKRLIRERQPDVVHTHSSKAGIIGRAAAAATDTPCVHTVHGASFHYGQNPAVSRAYIAAERWAARRCDRIVSVCDAMTDVYVAAGVAPRDKFTTVYSGFDVDPFLTPVEPREQTRNRLGLQPDDIVAATVARLFHLKGHETLLDAAPAIAADPRVKFLWVGDGVLRESYEARIASMGLSDRFVFTGLVRPDEVPPLMHAADLLVHPSQWEGLARVLPQALIAARPCVSYDVGGAGEVVVDGETGRLLRINDSDGLAGAVLELAGDARLRERMGQAGRELCSDLFRHELMTQRLREEYARAIDLHSRVRRQRVAQSSSSAPSSP